MSTFKINGIEVELIHIDITKIGEKADIIVNAANTSLLGGGGVDGAIHRAAGPELYNECKKLGGCKPGEAKVTKAYRLKNKYIIHTVGPIYYLDKDHEKTLENCYVNSLNLAESLNATSIAFPSISTGAYGYPVNEAAKVFARVVNSYKARSIKKIFMCIYDNKYAYSVYKKELEK